MEVRNEHGRPEGRPCIQHGKAGLSPSWRRGSHRIRPWRRRMRVRQPQGQPFSFCRRRTSTRKRREAGSAAAGAAILSQAALQESEQLLEQASTAPGAAPPHLPQHSASMAPWEWPWSSQEPQQSWQDWQPARKPMAARAMMEKVFIGLSFPKSEERNMGSQRALNDEFYANLGQRGTETCSFHR